jgi:2-polyprenyl-6-methoxyphenol hydroxylase-like FAD-dependent oxidoreductase
MNVLISGASIAGPALAYWLNRYGFAVTIVERAPELRDGGYKVDLRGASIEVARRMGILDDIRRLSTDIHRGTFVRDSGKPLATLGADFFAGRVAGDDEVMRGDLARLLYERTRHDVEYLFDDSITAIEQHPDRVDVTFENAPPRSFDLVIGADGLHSNTRALTFGELASRSDKHGGPEQRYTRHLGTYISIFSAPNHLGLDHEERFCHLPGKMVNIYSARDNTEARNLFIFRSPELEYDRRDTDAQKRIVADAFAGAGWEVPRMLEHMWRADDFYLDSCSLVELDHWSTGRVALVGDAAYCATPLSGQGTGIALVGAYVLAGELAAAAGDHVTAFANYESEMREYVTINHKFAEEFGGQLPTTPRGVWFIGLMLRTLPYVPWKGFIARKITDQIQGAANAITLRDYPYADVGSSTAA